MTLPVAAEIHRRAAADHQPDDRADLQTSAVPSVIFSPGQFPRVSQKIDSGDMMIMADLAAPRSGEEGLRAVGAGVVIGVLDGVIDPPGVEAGMQGVPRRGLVGVDRRGPVHPGLDEVIAASSLTNTAGSVPPRLVPASARSRITTTTWRLPLLFSARRRSLRSSFRSSGRTGPPKQAPSTSTCRPAPPSRRPRNSRPRASRILCSSTKAVLYWTSRSRDSASAALPFTSSQKTTTAAKYSRMPSLWKANSVPEVSEKSRRHAL